MIFISAPNANFDSAGNLTSLAGANLWPDARLTTSDSDYRVTTANSVSPAFTTRGSSLALGGAVAGNALRSFLIAPAANFTGDKLTSLSGCLLSTSQNVTGLLGNTAYRAMVLAESSGFGGWIIEGAVIQQSVPAPYTPVVNDDQIEA